MKKSLKTSCNVIEIDIEYMKHSKSKKNLSFLGVKNVI